MSNVIRHVSGARLVKLSSDHAMVTGTDEQIGAALDDIRRHGRLGVVGKPKPLGDGRLVLTCNILPPVQRVPELPARRRLSGRAVAAIVAAVLAVLGGLVWLAYEVLVLVVDHAVAIVAVLLVAGLLLVGGVGRACTTVITVRHHH